jgi:ethanolamine ammonia-lyase small subunit
VTWTVDVGGEQTTAVWDPPASTEASRTMKIRTATPVFVCAHGAGGQMNDRAMLAVRDALTAEASASFASISCIARRGARGRIRCRVCWRAGRPWSIALDVN